MVRIAWLIALVALCGGALSAQPVGSVAPNVTFLETWETPPGYGDLEDYRRGDRSTGHVVILTFWGAS